MRRYPPDTVPKYSEAKPSSLEEVKVKDQLRALGTPLPKTASSCGTCS